MFNSQENIYILSAFSVKCCARPYLENVPLSRRVRMWPCANNNGTDNDQSPNTTFNPRRE